jgi:broad specificity phosphatase PhoE
VGEGIRTLELTKRLDLKSSAFDQALLPPRHLFKEKELIYKDCYFFKKHIKTIKIHNKMAIKITYFVHSTSKDNENNISSGYNDVELSNKGIKQANELKRLIKNKKFDAVFSSDLKRAVQTAKIVFNEFIIDKRLRECNYGIYNGKKSNIVEPMQEKNIINPFPKGESYEDIKTRINEFLIFLKKNYEGKNIAIIGHKAPQLALDVLLKNKTWEKAFLEDWRKTKKWQPGWEYIF